MKCDGTIGRTQRGRKVQVGGTLEKKKRGSSDCRRVSACVDPYTLKQSRRNKMGRNKIDKQQKKAEQKHTEQDLISN